VVDGSICIVVRQCDLTRRGIHCHTSSSIGIEKRSVLQGSLNFGHQASKGAWGVVRTQISLCNIDGLTCDRNIASLQIGE
jgi:hypothetical protein